MAKEALTLTQIPKEKLSEEQMNALLLADPSMQQIQCYLSSSSIFELCENNSLIGLCVVQVTHEMIEIKNIVIVEEQQNKGYGQYLLQEVVRELVRKKLVPIWIATGNTSAQALYIYQKVGFVVDHVVANYFIKTYPEAIYENGRQCTDQVWLVYRGISEELLSEDEGV